MRDLLSVIVLSYKNVEGIYETVDSILKQDYSNIEIVISDDGTPEFAKYLPELEKYLETNKKENISNIVINAIKVNGGTVKSVNSAIRLSKGKYIKLLSSEDKLANERALSTYVAFLENNNFDIAFAKLRGVTPEGTYKNELLSYDSNFEELRKYSIEQTHKRLFSRNFLPAPGAFFSRRLFDEVGLFPEDTRLIEDYPFWLYLCMKEIPFGYIDEVLIDYKLSGVSSAGSYSEAFMKDMYVIYNKYIFPYDKRFGILQPIYNMLKRGGLNYYIAEAKRTKMTTVEKVYSRIKYLPFHILVSLQNFSNKLKG